MRPAWPKLSYSPPASELPGTQTHVREDSKKNLPSGKDRTPERSLPPGAATPNSPSETGGGTGRALPQGQYNTPDNDIDKRPRTVGVPGEQWGSPTKFDYGNPTRRLTAEYVLMDWLYEEIPESEGMEKLGYKRQRRQRGQAKRKSRMYYRRNRNKIKRQSRRRYKRVRKRPAFKRQRKLRRRNPQRYRRMASVLTAPEIAFIIGRQEDLGYVHGVSPMTGMVTFATRGGAFASMPVVVFLSSVAFLSEHDIEAMFDLIDAEVGMEAYEDLDIEAVIGCAELMQVEWDDDVGFLDRCEKLVGKRKFDDMGSEDLEIIEDALVRGEFGGVDEGVLEGGGRSQDDSDDAGNAYEIDPMDDALYYGEVDLPEYWEDARTAGSMVLYDQRPPELAPATDYSPGLPHSRVDDTPAAEPPDHGWDQPASSSRVLPRVDSTLARSAIKTAMRMAEIQSRTAPEVHARAKSLPVKLKRANPKSKMWTFEVRGSSDTYTVRIKGLPKNKSVKKLDSADVQVSCSCPFWRWQGPEHWAQSHSYLYGEPRGTASEPVIRDPDSRHWACKHVLAVFGLARNYYVASEESLRDLVLRGNIIPVPFDDSDR